MDAAVERMDAVFGIFYDVPAPAREKGGEGEAPKEEGEIPEEVLGLVGSNAAAKADKDWAGADALRDQILELGFAVKDVKGGDPVINRV